MKFTLSLQEKLKSSMAVGAVFTDGTAIRSGGLLVHVKVLPRAEGEYEPVKVAFAVSKRRFKRSVDRNYIKRIMRECYRLQKMNPEDDFFQAHRLHMVISYIHSERPDFQQLKLQMEKGLSKTLQHIRSNAI
ncbi:MAG: ribonuclease P protein component [Flavobacteriales bacterium]